MAARDVEPTRGARRRELVLLAGFVLVMITGVWTVVASEFGADEPASPHAPAVNTPTQSPK